MMAISASPRTTGRSSGFTSGSRWIASGGSPARRSFSRAIGRLCRAATYFAVNGSRSWTTGRATYLASYERGTTLLPGMAVTGAWGVLMAMARSGIFHVIDVVRIQGSPLEVERLKAVTAYADAQLTNWRAEILLQQEPAPPANHYVDAQMRGPLLGFTVGVEHPTGDKYTRALPMSSAAQAGNIKLVRGKWNKDFVDELEQAGPDEKLYDHDDQWDAASSAFNYVASHRREYAYAPVPRDGVLSRSTDGRFEEDLRIRTGLRRFGPGACGDDQIEGALTIGGCHGDSRSRARAKTGAGQGPSPQSKELAAASQSSG
jgi:predicted phage terminase large subunit-like protein